MAIIYKAPVNTFVRETESMYHIFLAGSIDMGKAENWQQRLERELDCYSDVVICNPRRDDWDSTWVQSIHNPQFNDQVTWELANIECADLVVFYFDPNGQAPITLMELGLCAGREQRTIVCCPDGYWRKGNVEMICDRYDITLCNTIDDLINLVKVDLEEGI